MNKLLIFDFDGVIVNTFDMALEITQMYDPECTADEYRLLLTGNIFETLAKQDRNRETRESFDFFSYYTPRVLELSPVLGIERALSLPNTKRVIISSSTSDPIREYLSKYGLINKFEQVLGADFEKSKIVKLQKVVAMFPKYTPIFVTDTLGDIREANKVAIPTIAVTWGYHKEEMLKEGNPMRIVDNTDELLSELEGYTI